MKTTRALLILGLSLTCLTGCRSMIEETIRDYLKEHPEVVKAQVDVALKERGIKVRQKPKTIEQMLHERITVDVGSAPVMGPKDALITIVAFSDFQCTMCKRAVPTMKVLVDDYEGQVRVAFRLNPLRRHERAMSAAKASLAAHEQGKFWEMHEGLFAIQSALSDENILKVANKHGLDIKKFESDWKSDKYDKQIKEDMAFARTHNVTVAPTFFVNGVRVEGARPVQYFKQLIGKLFAAKKPA